MLSHLLNHLCVSSRLESKATGFLFLGSWILVWAYKLETLLHQTPVGLNRQKPSGWMLRHPQEPRKRHPLTLVQAFESYDDLLFLFLFWILADMRVPGYTPQRSLCRLDLMWWDAAESGRFAAWRPEGGPQELEILEIRFFFYKDVWHQAMSCVHVLHLHCNMQHCSGALHVYCI